jgi:TDG/mug DNA glycosylase family protein
MKGFYKIFPNARILFVGINPHPGSYRRGVPFSNNKMLWYLFNQSGLIKESMADLKSDVRLKEIYETKFGLVYGFNFISLVDRPTIDATSLKKGEEQKGIKRLVKIIHTTTPQVVCFIGKNTYARFKGSNQCEFGWQKKIGQSKVFLMHFPIRGAASIRLQELKEIKKAIQKEI